LKTLVATKYVNSQFINLVEIEVLAINNDMELAKHYSNYRAEFYAKREAEEQNARVVREQLEKEEEEKHKQEINNKLAEAEKKILAKQLVSNDSIEESTLLLMLFKKYNINVPLKTQGWINKALAQVSYNDKTNNYTYSYYTSSKNSTVFREYFDQLISAIKHAYNQVTEEEKAIQEIVNTVKQKETDFLNSIQSISFEKCNNILREQMEFRQLLRNGKQKEFILEEVEALAKRAYKALKVDNINNSVLNYMRLYNPNKANKRLSFSKNNITITIEAVEQNNKIIYQFIKQYSNKSDTYIYKEVA
jgi:hypothetical protein